MTTNFVEVFSQFLEKRASFQQVREAWSALIEEAGVSFGDAEPDWLTTFVETVDLEKTIREFHARKNGGDRASVLGVTLVDCRREIFRIHYRCGFRWDEAFVPTAEEIRQKIAEEAGKAFARQVMAVLSRPHYPRHS